MQVTLSTSGHEELRQYMKNTSAEKKKRINAETYASSLDVRKEAIKNLKGKAWDLGSLAISILVDRVKGGGTVEIGPTAPHGPYVEFGTKPHFPPWKGPDAKGLEGWARRHGFDSAFPVALAISKKGTPAKPFLLPAYLAIVNNYYNRLKEILRK